MGFFRQNKPLLFPDITYSFYKVYCGLYQIDYEPVPLDETLSINVEDYLKPNGGIIFPNPNAPTGKLMPLSDIERLLQANTETLVVIDEATSTSVAIRPSAWSTATRICWSPRPCPSPVPWPVCVSVWPWAMRR